MIGTRNMGVYMIALALSIMVSAVGLAADVSADAIARVNDTTLLREELKREMKLVALKLTREGRSVSDEQLKRYEGQVRETLINRTLLLQESQSSGVEVPQKAVDQALEKFKAGYPDEKAYQKALTDIGFSEAVFLNQIQSGLAIKTLLDKNVLHDVSVSDGQVRAYYDENPQLFRKPEQVRASHILVKVAEDADEKAKAKALATIQGLQGRLAEGEKFAVLAQQYSDCPSKAKGGDLGFFTREQMVPPFSEAAFALDPGQTSDVVTTRFGYHLIRTIERKPEQTMAFNEVKEAIATRLRREKEGKEIDDYLENLRKKADIQRFPL